MLNLLLYSDLKMIFYHTLQNGKTEHGSMLLSHSTRSGLKMFSNYINQIAVCIMCDIYMIR